MDISQKIKDELENRLEKVEHFIANKGLGSKQLKKARNAQRNVNLFLFVGSIITIAGVTLWAMTGGSEEED
jgi:ribosome-associated translation inhibitor RaiA